MPLSRFAVLIYVIGGVCGLISVAAGALAAHALQATAPTGAQAVDWFRQASAFQINHALGAILAAAIADRLAAGRGRVIVRAGAVFLIVGAVLFPTALYLVSFGGPVFFAPFGGTAAMVGWGLFALGAVLAYGSNPSS